MYTVSTELATGKSLTRKRGLWYLDLDLQGISKHARQDTHLLSLMSDVEGSTCREVEGLEVVMSMTHLPGSRGH